MSRTTITTRTTKTLVAPADTTGDGFAVLLLALVFASALCAAAPARAASSCGTVGGAVNNPAFSESGSCPPKPAVPTTAASKKPGWTRTPDGRSVWTDGDSSVSVGGYVRYDQIVGRQPQR